jgi:PAS domain S-box-containing protein
MKFRQLFEFSKEGYALNKLLFDESGKPVDYIITDINPACEKILGLKKENVRGKRASEIYGTEKPPYLDIYGGVVTSGRAYSFETDFTSIGKSFTIAVFSLQKEHCASIFLEIADRRQVEDAQIEPELKYRTLYENMAQGVIYQDRNGEMISANPSAEKILGVTREKISNPQIINANLQFIHEDGRSYPAEEHPTMVSLNSGKPVKNEIMGFYAEKEKAYRWIMINTVPLFKPGETRPFQVFVTFDDITEMKKTEEKLHESEERFRTAITNAPIGIATSDVNKRFITANIAFCKVLGYTEDELRSMTFKDITHPQDIKDSIENISALDAGKMPSFIQEKRYIKRNGEIITARVGVSLVRDREGGPRLYIAELEDITDQRNNELKLLESQKRYQALVETNNDFIWEIGIDGRYTYCSPQMENLWGLKPEDMVGKSPFGLVPPEDRERSVAAFIAVIESGSSFSNLEIRRVDSTGNLRFLEISGVPFFNNNGQISGYRGISRDITERKRAQEALQENIIFTNKLLDATALSTWISDEHGTAIRANTACFQFFGATAEEVIGKYNVFEDESVQNQGLMPMIKRAYATGEPAKFQMDYDFGAVGNVEVKHPTHKFIEVNLTPILNKNGKVVNVVSQSIDISDIKRAEDELRASEEKFRNLYETMVEGIIYQGEDGEILSMNPSARRLFGVPLNETDIPTRIDPHLMAIHEDGSPYPVDEHPSLISLRTGQPVKNAIMGIYTRDGHKLRWLNINAIPQFRRGAEKPYQTILTFNDITERKEGEAKMVEIESLKRINRAKSELLANVSHELRTPLASIKGFIETLIETDVKWSKSQQRDFLSSANRETDRLTFLIRDLLDMSRIDSGKMVLDKQTYSMSEIMESARNVLSIMAKKHKLETRISPDLLSLNVDKVRIAQVITNLVENAVKFSPEGSTILIEAIAKDNNIVVSVEDKGEGIAQEVMGGLFNRFYQTERVVSGKTRGTGLGLAICKGIVEAHSGKIWVESEPGKGSKFSFCIPVNDRLS